MEVAEEADAVDIRDFSRYGVLTKKDVFRWTVPSHIILNGKENVRSDFFTFKPSSSFRFCLSLSSDPEKLNHNSQFGVCLCRMPLNCGGCSTSTDDKAIKVSFSLLDIRDRLHHTCERTMKECDRVYASFERSVFDKHHLMFFRKGNQLTIHCALDVDEVIADDMVASPVEAEMKVGKAWECVDDAAYIPNRDLTNDFRTLLDSEKFSDVTLSVHGKDFQVHRAILAARSPVFAAMFEHDTLEKTQNRVVIEDLSSEVISQFLHFLYTGETDELTIQTSLSLFVAADKYALPKLKKSCSDFLCSNLSTDLVLDVLTVANLHGDERLKQAAVQVVLDNAVKVVNTDDWLTFLREHSELANDIIVRLAMKSLQV